MSQKASPPRLVMCGYTTASTALAAMAASTAEPPARSASRPASDASAWGHVTIPCRARVSGLSVSTLSLELRLAPPRVSLERALHPDLGAAITVVVRHLEESVGAVEMHRGLQLPLAVEP